MNLSDPNNGEFGGESGTSGAMGSILERIYLHSMICGPIEPRKVEHLMAGPHIATARCIRRTLRSKLAQRCIQQHRSDDQGQK